MKKRVLFLSTGNSARSPMAEGLLRSIAADKYDVFSAGTHPKAVHSMAVTAMKEIGIDVSNHISRGLKEFLGQKFDYVISICDRARKLCPDFPDSMAFNWGFDDPSQAAGNDDDRLKLFRRTREEMMGRIRLFVLANRD